MESRASCVWAVSAVALRQATRGDQSEAREIRSEANAEKVGGTSAHVGVLAGEQPLRASVDFQVQSMHHVHGCLSTPSSQHAHVGSRPASTITMSEEDKCGIIVDGLQQIEDSPGG